MTDLIARLPELRAAADRAIPVPGFDRWIRLFGERTVYTRDPNDGCRTHVVVRTDAHPPSAQEAAYLDFIALANPATILALLDEITRLQALADSGEQPTGHVEIAHDGFAGEIIGHYVTREGKRGVVVQQNGTRVVHVYGEKWLTPSRKLKED